MKNHYDTQTTFFRALTLINWTLLPVWIWIGNLIIFDVSVPVASFTLNINYPSHSNEQVGLILKDNAIVGIHVKKCALWTKYFSLVELFVYFISNNWIRIVSFHRLESTNRNDK